MYLFATVCCLARFSRVKQDLGPERTLNLTGVPWGTLAQSWRSQEAVGSLAQDPPDGILNNRHMSRFPQSIWDPDCLSECNDQKSGHYTFPLAHRWPAGWWPSQIKCVSRARAASSPAA